MYSKLSLFAVVTMFWEVATNTEIANTDWPLLIPGEVPVRL